MSRFKKIKINYTYDDKFGDYRSHETEYLDFDEMAEAIETLETMIEIMSKFIMATSRLPEDQK